MMNKGSFVVIMLLSLSVVAHDIKDHQPFLEKDAPSCLKTFCPCCSWAPMPSVSQLLPKLFSAGPAQKPAEEAQIVFDKIRKEWSEKKPYETEIKINGFWHAAETYRALIDHLIIRGLPDSNGIAASSLKFFDEANQNKSWPDYTFWVDDYGWWMRFLMKAYNHADSLGYDQAFKEQLLLYAQNCWRRLNMEWNADGQGGIRNTTADKKESRKNSITNLLFCLGSAQIHLAVKSTLPHSEYGEKARLMWDWLNANALYRKDGFVLESPRGDNGTHHDHEWVWSGDQGIYLATLIALSKIWPEQGLLLSDKALDFARILTQAADPMIFVDQDGILHESSFWDNYSFDFAKDYGVGKGVVIAHLRELNLMRPERPFTSFLRKNAQAYWARVLAGHEYPRNWNASYAEYEQELETPDSFWKLVLLTVGLNALNGQY